MGYLAACFSVILVSVAQLAIKYALSELPPVWSMRVLWDSAPSQWLLLAAGLGCYLLSLIVWYFALRQLALGKAYAFLSLSYVLVWGGSHFLPEFSEPFSWQACIGVLAIVVGVLLVCWPSREGKIPASL
ncbi:4-amino-4-deoxy-L-arabinose-phosphoundecaprenol flippase subunit ArnF [Candidatus Symbiopectobacterium sp. NZEC135]|uniref:4-amino-4-deoxy-L-arabinose-phosphoundecaprenol flippase subunit ArnF n=1 Tax=Candidatus Symbiopectobacterium sp. NZEC135 TaxID=2820471 RepID=UPI002226FD3F|nr:4-amino-4-deoxy-L-arabinose-phosphoundecaprenol flippase subunit ArnF [Candidatus Symbiopectobacterium sp. NZEC135]MCW2481553.1 4-amino-4-deoxy-L-arabinose-phospho-UDP flippase [Candidatus Symbiopectobacterium sp. NZEC135]